MRLSWEGVASKKAQQKTHEKDVLFMVFPSGNKTFLI